MRQSGEISEAELLQWEKLPDFIRNDGCFSTFQAEAKHLTGESTCLVGDNAEKKSISSFSPWNTIKQILFALVWIIGAWHLLTVKERVLHKFDVSIDVQHTKGNQTDQLKQSYRCPAYNQAISSLFIVVIRPAFEDIGNKMSMSIVGALQQGCNASEHHVEVTLRDMNDAHLYQCFSMTENDKVETSLDLDSILGNISDNLTIELRTNIDEIVSFQLVIDPHTLDTDIGALLAAIILILLNVLIVSEVRNIRIDNSFSQ